MAVSNDHDLTLYGWVGHSLQKLATYTFPDRTYSCDYQWIRESTPGASPPDTANPPNQLTGIEAVSAFVLGEDGSWQANVTIGWDVPPPDESHAPLDHVDVDYQELIESGTVESGSVDYIIDTDLMCINIDGSDYAWELDAGGNCIPTNLVEKSDNWELDDSGNYIPQSLDVGDLGNAVLFFRSGANDGLSREIEDFDPDTCKITFSEPFPNAPAPGDSYEVYSGWLTLGSGYDQYEWRNVEYGKYRFRGIPFNSAGVGNFQDIKECELLVEYGGE